MLFLIFLQGIPVINALSNRLQGIAVICTLQLARYRGKVCLPYSLQGIAVLYA